MTVHVLKVSKFAESLCNAGILNKEDINNITRIVIDCNASRGTVIMYIVRVGDDPEKIAEALSYSGFEKGVLE